jgi:nitroimidazol reductase NimA-like FMN-containing flavoprotein (pyridoxamine 5'-phosphate oxidase superfamily)
MAELMATTFATYGAPTPWAQAQARLAEAHETYWLATTRPGGTPHVRPILAVWVDDALCFASGRATRKAQHLAANPRVTVTVSSDRLDLVVEGEATRIRDPARLLRVADAYAAKYSWPVTVRDGAFHDTEGAPTAGPPPYEVYAVAPSVVYGFPADDVHSPTRWRYQ